METLLKVCGMKEAENIRSLVAVEPDFIGFIFYAKSPRYVNGLDEEEIGEIPDTIKKVGVFVNESQETIKEIYFRYGLDYVQLHGDEDMNFAKELSDEGIKIIKVFRVIDTIPDEALAFEGVADYFLFDTAAASYGGTGRHFDWNILTNYSLETPFLLSGGVQLSDLDKIKAMEIEKLVGIDVNSKFEIEPGLKNIELVKKLKEEL